MENSSIISFSSISLNETYGSATIILNGDIPVPHGVSDPLAELFRPLKVLHVKKMLFTVIIIHRGDSVKLDIYPSNHQKRNGWCKIAIDILRGTSKETGLVDEYQEMLETYFEDKNGLELYLQNVAGIEDTESILARTLLCVKCDEDTKKFVEKQGHTMPSLKKPAN